MNGLGIQVKSRAPTEVSNLQGCQRCSVAQIFKLQTQLIEFEKPFEITWRSRVSLLVSNGTALADCTLIAFKFFHSSWSFFILYHSPFLGAPCCNYHIRSLFFTHPPIPCQHHLGQEQSSPLGLATGFPIGPTPRVLSAALLGCHDLFPPTPLSSYTTPTYFVALWN